MIHIGIYLLMLLIILGAVGSLSALRVLKVEKKDPTLLQQVQIVIISATITFMYGEAIYWVIHIFF